VCNLLSVLCTQRESVKHLLRYHFLSVMVVLVVVVIVVVVVVIVVVAVVVIVVVELVFAAKRARKL